MSGLEVIGSISAVVTLVDQSIKIYNGAQKDLKLSKTFETVGYRLPIILDTLKTCKSNLEETHNPMPKDVREALEKIFDACKQKAAKLQQIFDKTIPGDPAKWLERYVMIFKRFGKGNKVEDLMIAITKDVQHVVSNHLVRCVTSNRKTELEKIIEEMKSLPPSLPEEESSGSIYNSGGGTQYNYDNRGVGTYNINTGDGPQISGGTQTFSYELSLSVTPEKQDFGFHGPAGNHLDQVPHIASELFKGRDSELAEIEEILLPEHKPQRQQRLVIGGMGGIGKTQLVLAYAEKHHREYDSAFWLNAESETTLKDSFRRIAGNIFERLPEDEDIVRFTRQWLSNLNNIGWLLIFDNYDEPHQFKIRDYYPCRSHGAIVITTRRPDLVIEDNKIIMKPLNDDDGLAVLQARCNRATIRSDPHAESLAKRLEGLPLALATAGSYLQRSTFTCERYLHEYEKRWNLNPYRPTKLEEYHRTLYTTWDISYAGLVSECPDAAKLLKSLAYFSNQSIWYKLFQAGLSGSTPEWLSQVIADDVNFEALMQILTDYLFLDLQPTSESWSMHNCVHDWTLAALNKEIDPQYYWYAFDCVAASINEDDWDSLGRLRYSCLAAHATRLVQERIWQDGAILNIVPNRLDPARDIAGFLREQYSFLAAEQMYERVLAGYEKALEPDHISILKTVNNLGDVYFNQSKQYGAEQMYKRALDGYERTLGTDHIFTLRAVHNLGNLYYEQSKQDDAKQMYERALAGYEIALEPDHIYILRIVSILGRLYRDQDRLDEAGRMFERALIWREKALGPNDIWTLGNFHNLGRLYHDQGKLDDADRMFKRALYGREKALGADYPATLDTVNNLGNLYCDQGKLDDAEQMYERALHGFEKVLGPDHRSTLETVNNLGRLYRLQGRPDDAERMHKRVYTWNEKQLELYDDGDGISPSLLELLLI